MTVSAFPYVGGKSELAPWIVDHLPDHDCYVEPFAGSASVLLGKPRSNVEVLNDLDGDVVHFFETVRDQGDELREHVRDIPYSRQLYDEWADEFYAGYRPDDPIERAARWLYLRYAAFGGKYGRKTGFKRPSVKNHSPPSKVWLKVPDRVTAVRDRLQGVAIECTDALELLETYDSPKTAAYCDPPYIEAPSDYYVEDGIDHAQLEATLQRLECRAIVSYAELPEAFRDGWHVRNRDYTNRARRGDTGEWNHDAIERICMDYDPEATPSFVNQRQRQQKLTADGGFTPDSEGGGDP